MWTNRYGNTLGTIINSSFYTCCRIIIASSEVLYNTMFLTVKVCDLQGNNDKLLAVACT